MSEGEVEEAGETVLLIEEMIVQRQCCSLVVTHMCQREKDEVSHSLYS